jgi:4-hydroxythreonine-4-phosphate dehydrogenase
MKSKIGITMGDPAGIGPEVALKAISDLEVQSACTPVLIGEKKLLQKVAREIGKSENLSFDDFHDHWRERPGKNALFQVDGSAEGITPGEVSRQGGEAAAKYIRAGVELAQEKKIEALVTAPISKASLNLSGLTFSGHTEYLASLTGSGEVAMMFYSESLKVALLTTHLPLRKAIEEVKKEKIVLKVELVSKEYEKLFKEKPKIALCGLNPHSGEMSLFGKEEKREIFPAMESLRKQKVDVSGPFPADTIFSRALKKKEFDLIFCLYHDQGLIAMKSLNLKSVNITLGLPFVRTSPDHGTAFDIAGKNLADPSGMIQAIQVAAKLCKSV